MHIVTYPHPALRWKSSDITRIDDALHAAVRRMFELMYESRGIGLAANQVGVPLRFFIINLSGERDDPEQEQVFLNPVITNRRGTEAGEEGCLSLPGLYSEVKRAERVVVEAFNLEGEGFRVELEDLAARVVQHETDHLDGVLFIDRLPDSAREELAPRLAEFEAEFRRSQQLGEVPPDEEVRRSLQETARRGYLLPTRIETAAAVGTTDSIQS